VGGMYGRVVLLVELKPWPKVLVSPQVAVRYVEFEPVNLK
jgi:hypothetical protein